MSKAGKGKPNRIPGMHNGGSPGPQVPDDLPFPCVIYECSGDTEHSPGCKQEDDHSWEPSEIQAKLQNLQREYARNGMSMTGIPMGVPVAVSGLQVDLIELLCRIIALEDIVFDMVGMDREEFDDKYREAKFEFLNNVLETNKERVKKQQLTNALGLSPIGLLGPDGKPLG